MKYAVVVSGGKQYMVNEGEELLVDKLDVTKDADYSFPQVLLIRDEEKLLIGTPYVDEAKVSGKVLDIVKGDKITISKFKAKVHYRRKMGFRSLLTKIKIESISADGKSSVKKEKVVKKAVTKGIDNREKKQ